jgi:hypothetical protein
MNDKRAKREEDEHLLGLAAECMRRHADAALDGTHAIPDIPDHWALALLAMAGWLESERETVNGRSRPYALAAARSFIWADGPVG